MTGGKKEQGKGTRYHYVIVTTPLQYCGKPKHTEVKIGLMYLRAKHDAHARESYF